MTKAGGRSRKKEKKGEDNGIIVDDLPLLFWWEKGCILVVAIVVALFFQGYIAFEVISGQFGDVADTAHPMFEELQATVDNFKNEHTRQKFPKRSTGSICAIRESMPSCGYRCLERATCTFRITAITKVTPDTHDFRTSFTEAYSLD